METEDLLKLLETAPDLPTHQKSTGAIEEFILKFNLQEGEFIVPPRRLYDLYCETTVLPIGLGKFQTAMLKAFPKRAHNGNIKLNISPEFIDAACGTKEKKVTKPSRPPCYFQDYKRFINRAELKSGKQAILVKDLYKVYEHYQKAVKGSGKLMNYLHFTECTDLYFGAKKASKGLFVSINEQFKREFKDEKTEDKKSEETRLASLEGRENIEPLKSLQNGG